MVPQNASPVNTYSSAALGGRALQRFRSLVWKPQDYGRDTPMALGIAKKTTRQLYDVLLLIGCRTKLVFHEWLRVVPRARSHNTISAAVWRTQYKSIEEAATTSSVFFETPGPGWDALIPRNLSRMDH